MCVNFLGYMIEGGSRHREYRLQRIITHFTFSQVGAEDGKMPGLHNIDDAGSEVKETPVPLQYRTVLYSVIFVILFSLSHCPHRSHCK